MKNETVFEVFGMPPFSCLEANDIHVANWSLELSPESHDEEIRGVQDEKVFHKKSEMEAVISEALRSLSVTATVCWPELLRSIGNFWFSLLGSIF